MMCTGNRTCLGPEVVEQHGGQVALPKAGQDDHDELALVLDALGKPADTWSQPLYTDSCSLDDRVLLMHSSHTVG